MGKKALKSTPTAFLEVEGGDNNHQLVGSDESLASRVWIHG
jgi:hypothetical protein